MHNHTRNTNRLNTSRGVLLLASLLTASSVSTLAIADDDDDMAKHQVEPVELLVNYQISGNFTGMTSGGEAIYTIGGPGYAPKKIDDYGEIDDRIKADRQVAALEGAQITFGGAPTDPIVRFGCIAGSCKMTFKDGSVLVSDAGVALEGRAINMWGPVVNSPNFDPVSGIIPIRIMGCGGLREIAGKGRLANMIGSICFNGMLNFNQFDQTVLSGSSKCTLTLHTPASPVVVP